MFIIDNIRIYQMKEVLLPLKVYTAMKINTYRQRTDCQLTEEGVKGSKDTKLNVIQM